MFSGTDSFITEWTQKIGILEKYFKPIYLGNLDSLNIFYKKYKILFFKWILKFIIEDEALTYMT